MNNARQQAGSIIDQTIAHLTRLRDEGYQYVPASPAAVKGLTAPLKSPQVTPERVVPVVAHTPPRTEPAGAVLSEEVQGLADHIAQCQRCGLSRTRTRTVPGQGHSRPELIFIGEGPGADEDRQGVPFVGRAGKLLTKIIEAMGLTREEVWIGNIVKCRPPDNRVPTPEEMEACLPYLRKQIALLQPKVIVCLGATAIKGLVNPSAPISETRGQWYEFEGIPTLSTYHPAYLLRSTAAKRVVWEDMKDVLKKINRPVPSQA